MKRGLDVSSEASQKTTYDIPVEIRDTLGRISLSLKNNGMKKAKVIEVFHDAGYDVPIRSLTRWEKNIKDNGISHKKEKESGKPRSLSEEQERLLVGYVLCLNEQNQEVHLLTVRSWIEKTFGIFISDATAHRYLSDNGFSSRVMQSKTSGYRVIEILFSLY